MKKSRVRADKLEVGMVTAADVISITGITIVPKRSVLDLKSIDKIRTSGVTAVTVEANDDGSKIIRSAVESVEELKESPEFKKLKKNIDTAKNEVKKSLNKIVNSTEEINIDNMIAYVDNVMSDIGVNSEIFQMLNFMKEDKSDTFTHSVNVALMSGVLAKWAKISKADTDTIVASALLHDVGKLKIPEEITTGRNLSSADKMILRKHAIYGYNILKGRVDEKIAQVALAHHERYDGSGYPMNKKGGEIPKFARLIAIADIFDENTSKRDSTLSVCPFEVIRMFETDGYQKFDAEYLLAFLSGIADTYIGYNVELSNGKRGTIVFSNKLRPSRPMVKVDNRYVDLGIETGINIVKLL